MKTNKMRVGAFVVLTLAAAGCGLQEIKRQTTAADDIGVIKGKIEVKSDQKGPIIVYGFADSGGILTRKYHLTASDNGNYRFSAEPGMYAVAAFIDVNGDGNFQRGLEHGNFNTDPLTFNLEVDQTVEAKTIVISGDPPLPPADEEIRIEERKVITNIGVVISLDDPVFVRENYNMGMWKPIDFLDHVGGGLFFLQEYDENKIPVLFVHGIAGGPTDLQALIESMDQERFQPWILYYPSGLRLDMISDYMLKAVAGVQDKHGFNQMILVAHSMGGLVTRSFVKKYVDKFPERTDNLRMVMTINSPLGGMHSATGGVNHSPIIVPSWRDVADNSEFLSDLHAWVWPQDIPYYLVFSYKPGKDDDGVVGLNSQLPLKLQSEATRMFGFNNTHVGTVHDEAFIALFNEMLSHGENGGSFAKYVVTQK
jgi:pimeloyl-ACP methyl ester carboxylesterase